MSTVENLDNVRDEWANDYQQQFITNEPKNEPEKVYIFVNQESGNSIGKAVQRIGNVFLWLGGAVACVFLLLGVSESKSQGLEFLGYMTFVAFLCFMAGYTVRYILCGKDY